MATTQYKVGVDRLGAIATEQQRVVVALGLGAMDLYAAPCIHPDGSEGWSIPFSYQDVADASLPMATATVAASELAQLRDAVALVLTAFSTALPTADAVWLDDPDFGGEYIRLTAHVTADREDFKMRSGEMYEAISRVLDEYPGLTVAPTILRDS